MTGLSRDYGSGRLSGQQSVRKLARAKAASGGPAVCVVHQGKGEVPVAGERFTGFASWRHDMQGTIVMLMALSGLGCHHKACDTAYAPSCYSGGCYGGCYATEYSTVVEPSCYSACYSALL